MNTGLEGNFINGFYEREKIRYGEGEFWAPLFSASLFWNLPNLKETKLFWRDEEFDMRTGMVEDYSRVLHMKEAILERNLLWTSPKGRQVRIRIRRLASFQYKKYHGFGVCRDAGEF